jgi:hypothetical protein
MELKVSDMNKQQLINELEARSITFDKTANVKVLRELLINYGAQSDNTVVTLADVSYLKNPDTGRVFEATEHLLSNKELVPATEEEYRNQ